MSTAHAGDTRSKGICQEFECQMGQLWLMSTNDLAGGWLCKLETKEVGMGVKAWIVLKNVNEPVIKALGLNINVLKELATKNLQVMWLKALG